VLNEPWELLRFSSPRLQFISGKQCRDKFKKKKKKTTHLFQVPPRKDNYIRSSINLNLNSEVHSFHFVL